MINSFGTFIRTAVRGRRAPWARAVVGCALVMGLAPVASAGAQTGSAVQVVNRATVTFTTDDGGTGSAEGSSTVYVRITPGVRLSAPQTAALRPGDRRAFAHRLENLGNGPDRFVLGTSGPAGWSVRLFLDLDGDGVLGAADIAVSSPLPLDRGASAALLLVVDVPPDVADVAGVVVEVRATSTLDPSVTDVVRDVISVRRPLAAVTLAKSVDRAEATVGDTLVYTLSFANGGDAAATPAELADPLPAGLHPVAGSIRLNGNPLTDAADADAGSVERGTDGRQTVRVKLGELAGGASGVVVFRAVVAADAGESLSNGATIAFGSPLVEVASPIVRTALVRPGLTVSKERIGSDTVQLGAEVAFRLGWGNSSATVAVREAVLTDTLPAGLAFVRAEGNPEVRENVIRWTLGTLAPGQTGSLLIVTRAVAASPDAPLVNRVVARGSNAAVVAAAATPVMVTGLRGNELEVTKRAAVLEAGLGEAVPYSVTVTNRALVPLRDVRVTDFLPAGVRFLAGRLTGADSARVDGSTVHIFLGNLAAAETRTVRYAVTIVSPGAANALGNRATATAEGGRIHSDTVTAWVRLRRGSALQARTVMGKVWLDSNNNGRQEPGEQGVAGVDVWSEDGEVVTTDRYGRYSFRNVRIGTHALRVDTVGLPGNSTFARRGEGIVQIRMDGWTTPR
ncbi:MAG TPA: SdrD B-like domain-containing protein, partial [Longimicrobium sp.]|nr:SdrD B-like domain-containing protein [Longimicrobium sp.]